MIEEFKKKLNKLLLQFPDLPECTFTIRPRITIDMTKDIKEVPKKVLKDLLNIDKTEKFPQPIQENINVDKVLSLEKGVNKARIAELSKSIEIQ